MAALLTARSGAPVGENAAVQIRVECFENFMAKRSILRLIQLLVAPLELISVMVHDPVERGLLGAPARISELPLTRSLPCAFHMVVSAKPNSALHNATAQTG